MSETKQYSKNILLLSLILLSLLLMLVSNLTLGSVVRNAISYVYTPVAFEADQIGQGVGGYWSAFRNITQLKTENEDLKNEIALLKSQNAVQALSDEENAQLKSLLKLKSSGVKYIKGEVMSYDALSGMVLNKGVLDGVKNGDAVITNNTFVGLVDGSDNYSSKIRSIYDKASSIKVMIVSKKDQTEDIRGLVKSKKFVNAVMIGKGDHIEIQNISINKGVRDGDLVFTSDDRIGQYIAVGELEKLTTDLAVSTLSSHIKSYIDFTQFKFVFVITHD